MNVIPTGYIVATSAPAESSDPWHRFPVVSGHRSSSLKLCCQVGCSLARLSPCIQDSLTERALSALKCMQKSLLSFGTVHTPHISQGLHSLKSPCHQKWTKIVYPSVLWNLPSEALASEQLRSGNFKPDKNDA